MKAQCMVTAAALILALPVGAQIYRCEFDGTIAFSDLPCGPDSAPYTQSGGASFVTPDENLPEIAKAAQAYIRQRRERLAQDRSPQPPRHAEPSDTEIDRVVVPWWAFHSHDRRHLPHDLPRRRQGPPPVIAGNDRYSPLNGPILGTRPESAVFEHRSRSERRPDPNR